MRRALSTLTAIAAAGILAAAPTTQAQAAQPGDGLRLPAPTGSSPVGFTSLHRVDEGRPDPWAPTEDRELMVSLWYPAQRPSGEPAPYMTAEESALYLADQQVDVPPDTLAHVVTNATVDARPAKGRHTAPLVLLSPGFGRPRAMLTGLAEDLASRGYVVAAIGHNYEASGTTFPDGRTTTCLACGQGRNEELVANRAADNSFVLDSLTGRHPVWKGAKLIDAGHVALVGQSIGGAGAIPTLLGDARFDAGVNMDGRFYPPYAPAPSQPFLMLGSPNHEPGRDSTWDTTWPALSGWKRWITVDGMLHGSFTDVAPLAKQAGLPDQQELDGDYAMALTRAYVAAFLDTHLRGCGDPLMSGPSADYPEARFHRP